MPFGPVLLKFGSVFWVVLVVSFPLFVSNDLFPLFLGLLDDSVVALFSGIDEFEWFEFVWFVTSSDWASIWCLAGWLTCNPSSLVSLFSLILV